MFKCQNVKLITVYCPGGFAGCAFAVGAVGCAPDTGAPIPALYPSGFLTWTFSVLSSLCPFLYPYLSCEYLLIVDCIYFSILIMPLSL